MLKVYDAQLMRPPGTNGHVLFMAINGTIPGIEEQYEEFDGSGENCGMLEGLEQILNLLESAGETVINVVPWALSNDQNFAGLAVITRTK